MAKTEALDYSLEILTETPLHIKNNHRKAHIRWILNVVFIYLVLIVLTCLYYYAIGYSEIKIGFYCKDSSLSHVSRGNTITTLQTMIYNFMVIPCLTVLVVECFKKANWKDKILNSAYLLAVFELGALVAFVTTRFIKTIYSEYRPTFFDVCRPDTNQNCTEGTYVESFVCLNAHKMTSNVKFEISRSFPSTHTGLTLFVVIFCGYILQTRIPNQTKGLTLKHTLCFLLMLWGIFSGFTRISDREHHWWDVFGGAIVGITAAIYVIRTAPYLTI
ncbi:phospholipid phosphatase homolog 1.2 homolog isoform X2 [Cylas formicarius]|uniref:phospholipid phosphatase homolog 1.2 homolog isoform X2 n=1 Tax=Cylas formicarius TaxID=197179 RepID=UPI00295836C8|nr:phospholipid phosphatase homolog 1.2 homolog isoform X2 [Cylas formicarius]